MDYTKSSYVIATKPLKVNFEAIKLEWIKWNYFSSKFYLDCAKRECTSQNKKIYDSNSMLPVIFFKMENGFYLHVIMLSFSHEQPFT